MTRWKETGVVPKVLRLFRFCWSLTHPETLKKD